MAKTDHALVVGINRYPELSNLQGPEADAIEFADWLKTDPRAQVPGSQVTRLLSSDYAAGVVARDAKPIVADIDAALEAHIDRADQHGGDAGNRLYLYFAGHGMAPDADEVALLMANAARRRIGHHIAGRSYTRWFREASLFREIVLFMDCCREPTLYMRANPPPWDRRRGNGQTSYLVGFATSWPSAAREMSPAPGAPVRGLFTRILIEGLKGAAPVNAAGDLTASILEGYVLNRFKEVFEQAEEPAAERQEPRIDSEPKNTFVVLSGGPLQVPVSVSIRRSDGGQAAEIRVFNHQGEEQASAFQAGTMELKLQPGWYKATAGPNRQLFEVSAKGGPLAITI